MYAKTPCTSARYDSSSTAARNPTVGPSSRTSSTASPHRTSPNSTASPAAGTAATASGSPNGRATANPSTTTSSNTAMTSTAAAYGQDLPPAAQTGAAALPAHGAAGVGGDGVQQQGPVFAGQSVAHGGGHHRAGPGDAPGLGGGGAGADERVVGAVDEDRRDLDLAHPIVQLPGGPAGGHVTLAAARVARGAGVAHLGHPPGERLVERVVRR